ncbi:phage terminase small subunit P27 family [Rhizobium ruizarguesonis]|uniref:phage terminase small subunit P27 family n=1 Tax=Rhizobium TaxID=379 RepID=UPI0010303A93|nr:MULTISPECIES: phage terminase small subunit P27 family [Rhizobium]MDI5926462.1 phage terminase small subunit P27 family [Rhizobium leguminosarum]TAW88378.1 phage terminase small subunit P27 family [Rhizobium ruizarguesonis]
MARGRKAAVTALDGALSAAPPAPKWLPPHAKAEWRRVVPQLVIDRKIAAHELGTVEAYCLAVANMRTAEAIVAKDGPTYVSPTGELKRHPATTLVKEAVEASRRLAAELGLTPASRTKNKGGAAGNDDDDALGDI